MSKSLEERVREIILDVPNFPKAGILFKDITPLLASPSLLRDVISAMSRPFVDDDITHILAVESRGFLFGVPIALALNAAFVPLRKPGKLPRATISEPYALEYGSDLLEMHADALG